MPAKKQNPTFQPKPYFQSIKMRPNNALFTDAETGNWYHSIQITFYHAFAIKLFSFAGLPGRKNNLPALDDRRTRKSLSPKTDAEDLNSFKSSS